MNPDPEKYLISVVGPTASGKTALAIELARWFHTEIISADSRQVFRELTIGTAKPSADELAQVPHHFIDTHSIADPYDVGQFEEDVMTLLGRLFHDHQAVLMAGGSGLYCKAVWSGLDQFPEIGGAVREGLIQEHHEVGLAPLLAELSEKDPTYYASVDRQNPQRIIRALEVIRGTGQSFSSFRKQNVTAAKRDFRNLKIGLELPRELLYERIELRMDQMIAAGLFEEARGLIGHRELNALQTVGYSEIFPFFAGTYDRQEAIRLLKRNSRRYAKRQLTWFKRDPEIVWFRPTETERIKEWIGEQMGC